MGDETVGELRAVHFGDDNVADEEIDSLLLRNEHVKWLARGSAETSTWKPRFSRIDCTSFSAMGSSSDHQDGPHS